MCVTCNGNYILGNIIEIKVTPLKEALRIKMDHRVDSPESRCQKSAQRRSSSMKTTNRFLADIESYQLDVKSGPFVAEGIRFKYIRNGQTVKSTDWIYQLSSSVLRFLNKVGKIAVDTPESINIPMQGNPKFRKCDLIKWRPLGNQISVKLGYIYPSAKNHDNHIVIELIYRHSNSNVLQFYKLQKMSSSNRDSLMKTWGELIAYRNVCIGVASPVITENNRT